MQEGGGGGGGVSAESFVGCAWLYVRCYEGVLFRIVMFARGIYCCVASLIGMWYEGRLVEKGMDVDMKDKDDT